jgi:nucleolar protein 56
VQSLAKQILELNELRKKLEEHVQTQMTQVAPNLAAILGTAVGARILARAGSMKRLARMPASTIQVLGAEKALFRSLKTGSQPPKHGLLFQHAMVHAAPRWQRGKIARAVAAKAAIASRVDVFDGKLNNTLLEKLNVRVEEISKKYKNPVPRESKKDERPRDFRSNRDFRSKGDFKSKGKKKKSKMKGKKRKRSGRR